MIIPNGQIALNIGTAFVGAVFGVAAMLLQPTYQDPFERAFIALFGRLPWPKRLSLAGEWSERWWEDDAVDMDQWAADAVTVRQFGQRIVARFPVGPDIYRLSGRIDAGRMVTGVWHHEVEGATYHGAFQLRIFPSRDLMHGKWVGFGRDNTIKSGNWQWKRSAVKSYNPPASIEASTGS